MYHAVIQTNKWSIRLVLYTQETPYTVANFVTLAKNGFYNNLKFHRVIDEFMIQGWCPYGTGVWWPWYQFADEFHANLRHDSAGIVSMANSGPHTNGSQFFITHVATPRLDDRHTVFAKVYDESDQEIVNQICQWDIIESITISQDYQLPTQVDEFVQAINDTLARSTS